MDNFQNISPIRRLIRFGRAQFRSMRQKNKSLQDIFSKIYQTNQWHDADSRSGEGSNLEESQAIRDALPRLMNQHGIRSILDIPCGDFFWMKEVDLADKSYIGGDIVPDLIQANKQHQSDTVRFECLDLTSDPLPHADLILVRDCLVHLPFEKIMLALKNILSSEAKFLLTTTFVSRSTNIDVIAGAWRPLNLEKAPFLLPSPLELINENHPAADWKDKSLGFWDLADLRDNWKNELHVAQ